MLFSTSQLDNHARALATAHSGITSRGGQAGKLLLERLGDNERALASAYELLTSAIHIGRRVTPAAEWLVDNYSVVEEQVRTARRHLPPRFSRELPQLVSGEPRVYRLAIELISHSHGRLALDRLMSFIAAYTEVRPLRIGELWAVPIMLRLALLENLRSVVDGVAEGRRDRERATAWVVRLVDAAGKEPNRIVLALADLLRGELPLHDAFAAELASQLHGYGAALQLPALWLEQRLAESDTTIEQVFSRVAQSQAADQVTIGNTIGSMRLLGATDWRVFVEAMSSAERALRDDPSCVYASMDFGTRDRYRHVVEAVAALCQRPEDDVARAAVGLARSAKGAQRHVGWWLVGDGRAALEREMGRPSPWNPSPLSRRLALGSYIGTFGALTIALSAGVVTAAPRLASPGAFVLLLVGASELASAALQWTCARIVQPRILPRLDFSAGIPAEHRTLVAVPALLTDPGEIDALVGDLEVRYLANVDEQLGLALITDFRDAEQERMPGDAALLRRAEEGVAALNRTYTRPDRPQPFFLLHRARRWNPCERVWMGWERKRGKLEELNAALRGNLSGFDLVLGDIDWLSGVRYVLALDRDTELPRDAARELAGILAHPLNRPRYDPALGRVVEGYGILQPRVGVSLASARSSRFSSLFSGESGIDPYTRAVSDVYQDVFDEGSFVGKGIYDVDAFIAATAGRLPENRILSHDLLEGAYARAGLVSDVLLFEDHPSDWAGHASRRSRWTRGDWQITPWLGPRVPSAGGKQRSNPISLLSRWKILDNLRRSLVPIALTALLIAGWVTGTAGPSSLLVLAIFVLPGLLAASTELVRPSEIPLRARGRELAEALARQIARAVVSLAALPYDAALSVTSIVQALSRVQTQRRLLEWRTAADDQRSARASLLGTYRSMWIAPAVSAATAAGLAAWRADALVWGAPVLALWAAAPCLTWWLSLPISTRQPPLQPDDALFLRGIARRTWRFFEAHVGPEDNYLVPDNFQEDPPRGVAHRTSPTNIGLSLTASLAAHDLGYLTTAALIERLEHTIRTIERLERFRGHLYNWYDTRSLAPLRPAYVSTVDSGNLSGHLLTLAVGLEEILTQPVFRRETFGGLADVLAVVGDFALPPVPSASTLSSARDWLLSARDAAPADGPWRAIYEEQRRGALDDLIHLAPWLVLPEPTGSAMGGFAPTLVELAAIPNEPPGGLALPEELQKVVQIASQRATERIAALRDLAKRCRALADHDYSFLYDTDRHLLAIGYQVSTHQVDPGFYDLLASEARLGSFVAIAQEKLPQEHWFRLGRQLTTARGRPVLLSWSGSMFEYLMPLLLMPSHERTLLGETCRGAVARQIEYGRERATPWGVSESGYAKIDAQRDYQYGPFGVPGLGLKRGLADDLVIAPYASALALLIDPQAAIANLRRLIGDGSLGALGLYEALDYTPARLPPGTERVIVRSFMAHHQGMTLLACASVLLDQPMQRRFLAHPPFRAAELLLQERVPRTSPIHPHPAEIHRHEAQADTGLIVRRFTTPDTPAPEVHLLSNGSYHVAVTNAGGGYSRWRNLDVTRWHEDPTRDCWGSFCYLCDTAPDDPEKGRRFWSVTHQPTLVRPARYEVIFSPGRAEFRRSDGDIDSHVEISVSPEDDVELRQVTLTNNGRTTRTIEITSYAEVVLAPGAADAAHRAFSGLFVQTEIVRSRRAVLCTRRPRSPDERPPWMLHLMAVHGATEETSYETSRSDFVGRGRTAVDPDAMRRPALGDTQGAVLDPIAAIRTTVSVPPGGTARIHLVTGISETRDGAIALIDKYSDRHSAKRVFDLSWTNDQVLQRRLGATEADAHLYERLASYVLYANASLRAPGAVIARNRRGQSALWAYSISGDLPIVLVRLGSAEHLGLVRQMVQAHALWRLKGLPTDLIVWNEDPSVYRHLLHDEILAVISAIGEGGSIDRPGGIFVRRADQLSEEDQVLMLTVARVVVSGAAGSLADQVDRRLVDIRGPRFVGQRPAPIAEPDQEPSEAPIPELISFNGLGGFRPDGREYVIVTSSALRTPAPWVNVLANPTFGTVVSESGGSYTWCENARNYRLTPWHNDPLSDTSGEALWIRDEHDGRFWSPTPLPAGGPAPYITRHGFGYTTFEHTSHGISSHLRVFVDVEAPVKFLVLAVRNTSSRPRRLSLTACFELVLGERRSANLPYVVTEVDPGTGALLARNAWSAEFASRVAFLSCSEEQRTATGHRSEVLGRNGTWAAPQCMERARLSGRVGAALDPCLAMRIDLTLSDKEERVIVLTLGSGADLSDARGLVTRLRSVLAAQEALERVSARWERLLGAVQVTTPDPALDRLTNGWLVYQILSARLWGRTGLYQSGGAYGFRDQLQDAMALTHTEPALLREQILRAAGRQFKEGDVQHWWHPPLGSGVRTRISDDLLFLPYAVCRYLEAVGDNTLLDELVGFIEGRAVEEREDGYYDRPGPPSHAAPLYEHCVRAIRRGLALGAHGLPRMGSGDWNDAMSRVGDAGRGESVWLAFFLYDVLTRFGAVAQRRGDPLFARECASAAEALSRNIDEHAWDGEWYLRAWYDDGEPLGSSRSAECRIDSLPQSWAVLSGAASPERARCALLSVDRLLVRRDLGLVQLFDPPFDESAQNPGYIKGYPPGVRENGGQYTHAAVWVALAFATLGETERAWELLGLLSPARHGESAASVARYRVEPYVLAADVYTSPQHAGRGGWTWYTGAAGWTYRLIVESLLGLRLHGGHLFIEPLLPAGWPGFEVRYRFHDTPHHIRIYNRGAGRVVTRICCDGLDEPQRSLRLRTDGAVHEVEVDVGGQ